MFFDHKAIWNQGASARAGVSVATAVLLSAYCSVDSVMRRH
jgi:hypothetical protein